MRPTRPSTATQPRQDARDGLWMPIDSKVSQFAVAKTLSPKWVSVRPEFVREFLPARPAAGTLPTCRTGDLP